MCQLLKAPRGTISRKSQLFRLRTARTSRQEKMRGLPKVCVKRRAQNAERARKKRRHTRLIRNAVFCLDCGEQLPVPVHTKKRCPSCQIKFHIDNKRKRRAKKLAAQGILPPVCCDCGGPGRCNKPRCELCQKKKKFEDESKVADFLEALGRPDVICCDCREPGRVGKQRCASCAVELRNDRRRERQKRRKAAQLTLDKPEPICCDCRGRAQIGISGRLKKRCAPCELEEKKARSRLFQERRRAAKPAQPDPVCCDCGKQLQVGIKGQRPKRCAPCRLAEYSRAKARRRCHERARSRQNEGGRLRAAMDRITKPCQDVSLYHAKLMLIS